ncbi:hypothetical protein ARMGADRAFT_1089599 [Armillaria gallica]|uniref:Retrotransposon gag domain-containing protein n=1 Tax=Armillaria gallica TaxID=47427 RepID=A0A2H3CJN6_ARMGA|nr:hypothetical protein ARMGADRAFT_1089599 [Armillaria gallica]
MLTTLKTILVAAFFGVGTALFAVAVVLAALHHHRLHPRPHNQYYPQPVINHVLPRQPPPVHFYPPLPVPSRRALMVNEHPRFVNRRDEEDFLGEMEVSIQKGSNGEPTRARHPVVQLSAHNDPSLAGSTGHTPIQHNLLLPLMQQTWQEQPANGSPGDSPTGSAFRLDILWDNINLPYTAFFPRRGNPYRARTPDPDYPIIHWDQPIQITEQPPTPPILTRESMPEFQQPEEIPGYDPATFLSQYDRDRRAAGQVRFAAFRKVNEEAGRITPEGTTYYSSRNASTEPRLQRSPTLPRLITLITMPRALYLLLTGKLTEIPKILFCAPLLNLFNHFLKELVEDPNWAITPAGMDYTHYGYEYILKEEARHFACVAYNMIHQEQPIEVPTHYQQLQADLSLVATNPEPMRDSPLVLPQRAMMPTYTYVVPSYAYPWRYGPPGSQGPSRLFAMAGIDDEGTLNQPQLPSGPPRPPAPPVGPMRWAPPRYPPPPGPPDPPAPWILAADNQGPWAALKPNMVKKPDGFSGDLNVITRFFSQCDMYFSVFNQYFQYHPHKVIFCTSHFTKDTQVWWELCARELGRNVNGDQVYPAYKQFIEEVRWRFWKDANTEIKLAQWERLRQSNLPDGDLFFQQFESLVFKASVLGVNQMMVAQVKKACQSTSKDIIYRSDGDVLTTYQE